METMSRGSGLTKYPSGGRKKKRRRRKGKKTLIRIVSLVGVIIALTGAGILARAALTGVSARTTFTVEEIRIEGARYLDPADLLALVEPERFTSEEVRVEELEVLGEKVRSHPLVERVSVRRSLPASVVIEVVERIPVAFLEGSPIRGIDSSGMVLQGLEPPRYGALPFITGVDPAVEGITEILRRAVKVLEELRKCSPRFFDQVSEVQPRPEGEIALVLCGDAVVVRLRESRLESTLPLVGALITEGRRRHAPLSEVDLRFADTVIYRELKGGE